MAHDIHKFTVQEAQNVQLGQGPTAHLDSGTAFTNISNNNVVVAIQVIQDCAFDQLVAEDLTKCIGTNTSDTHNPGKTGDIVSTSTTFVAGLVIYGRWT
ncbi:MAG: hypothetical protein CBC83_00095, partial [Flavobacteriales bacterium TMED123]